MELICTLCPKGCRLNISENLTVTGNKCPKGEKYARDEALALNPVRTLTTTVTAKDFLLPVRSDKPIPKEKMIECMEIINRVNVRRSVNIGDIIIENIYEDVNMIATRNFKA